VYGDEAIPAGDEGQVVLAYDGGGLGKGGTVTLYQEGDTTDVGTVALHRSAASTARRDSAFSGQDRCVEIDLGEDAETWITSWRWRSACGSRWCSSSDSRR
jgi:hypothetical protein